MIPHRFYLPPEQSQGPTLTLPEREAHHARHVLRIQPGHEVVLLDGQGGRFLCQVARIGRRAVEVIPLQKQLVARDPWQITLIQAVTKPKSMEILIQKATELGVSRIVPLLTERVAVRIEPGRPKQEKWRWIAIDAMKQADAAWLPTIEAPVSLTEYIARAESFALSLVGSLESSQHPGRVFDAYAKAHRGTPPTLAIWIGPEGDFTPPELAQVQSAGAQPISLGSRILRAETAAIYCLAIAHYEVQAGRNAGSHLQTPGSGKPGAQSLTR